MTKTGVVTQYRYNVNGIRNEKSENGVTTRYRVDENRDYAQVLVESNAVQDIVYSYGDDLISQTQNGVRHYYAYDGLGSTRALTDGAGQISDRYNYDAFGVELNKTGTTPNAYRFTGEQYDSSLKEYYLRARYYDPKAGRFTQMDGYQGSNFDPVSLHKYLYASGNPVNGIDPSGYMTIGEAGAAANVASNLYTVASIGFQFYTGNYAGAAKDIVEEVVYSKFGGAFGKQVVKLSKEQVQLFFRVWDKNLSKTLILGKDPLGKTLEKNLSALGVAKPFGTQAHHIVGQVSQFGKKTQDRLKTLGIDLNSPMNGVFLPGCGKSNAIGMVHCGKHTKAYEEEVYDRVMQAGNDKVAVINALSEIRNALLTNSFVPLNKRAL